MGYTLLLSLIEYKTLVMRGDFDAANEILPQIPQVCNPAVIGTCLRTSMLPCYALIGRPKAFADSNNFLGFVSHQATYTDL